VILLHAFTGWAICGVTIGISFKFTTILNALIIHAVAAPVVFGIISFIYYRNFNYTSELKTATIFLIFTMTVDFFLVALIIQKSLAMFESLLGTWIPFILIFISSYIIGKLFTSNSKRPETTSNN
jgi:hypothetical protein